MTFSDPELLDPVVHCFARCNWCKRLVPIKENEDGLMIFDERACPHCGVELSEQRLFSTFVEKLFHTAAITSANKFISLDLAVIPFMAVSLLITFMEYPVWIRILNLVLYHGPIILCLRWLYRYWYVVRFNDEEYIEAVALIRRTLLLWIAANLVNWIFIFVQYIYYT